MKLTRTLGIALAAFAALSLSVARAEFADSKTFEPAVVASGAALTFPATGALDTGRYTSLHCQMRTSNEAGGASRLFIPKCTDSTGGTTFYTFPTTTVVTNSTQRFSIDPKGVTTNIGTVPAGTTVYPVAPCRYMKVTAAAANGITQISCSLKNP